MTCNYWQKNGYPALMWASKEGHADTARLLVQHGAALDLVDEVNIHKTYGKHTCKHMVNMCLGAHAHALASTCCIKHG